MTDEYAQHGDAGYEGDTSEEVLLSPAATAAGASGLIGSSGVVKVAGAGGRSLFRRDQIWSYFGPAFVASVAYIDPGNFATNILGGSQFGYRLLWVLLWSNAMAILIQYLSAKLGIVTGETLPQSCRRHFSKRTTIFLWVCAEISAVATDMAEFLGAALGLDLLMGPALMAHGLTPVGSLFASAMIATVGVFAILALDLAGFQWLERGIMAFVGVIGLCYGFEVFLVHPDWHAAFVATVLPTFDMRSSPALSASVFAAVGMLGATVMPHVIYLHSALVQPRLTEIAPPPKKPKLNLLLQYLRFELVDVFVAMNGAWLINSAMIVMAAVALGAGYGRGPGVSPTIQDAFHTLGPLLGPGAAVVFAVALLCSGLSSSTVGVMAGQVIIEGFLDIKFPIFVRRFITVVPALIVIAVGADPLKILIDSQVLLSFTLPAALIPLLLLTNRRSVMSNFVSALRTKIAGWVVATVILALNAVLLVQLAM
ncbi:Mn(2+) uptake NRAMP transporter MntH [Granulicella sp. 5B5]|uniref:Nramp family divalent metal transporter n=1 Tax=Granulicella sp. 5B5 TaxID=1617967 RepID=UPI0015F3D80F|nr:Nramp family divalent metal transporter [Granulicella sp. 5B5]QMV18549.1 Mn(2+) uptake NRAMP transporter MntH [Granulicella sp. 5B5]